MAMKFYKCAICGNVLLSVKENVTAPSCCDRKMENLKSGVIDASQEKHVPVVKIENNLVFVEVGSVAHPMNEDHYIEWIAIETGKGGQYIRLNPGDEPKAYFALPEGDKVKRAFAYCNLHSLWETKVK